MTRRTAIGTWVSAVLAGAVLMAAPAHAAQGIDSFSVSMSTTQAGGHPDFNMSFTLDSPGSPESVKSATVNMPQGIFGSPIAIVQCSATEFALDSCPFESQAGIVTIRANYGSDPDAVMGTAPVYNMVPQGEDETARFSLVVPTLDIPITIPIQVRTGSDYGLRFKVQGLTQIAPLAAADLTIWGFPADDSHILERFQRGTPGNPPGCPGLTTAGCIATPAPTNIPNKPLTINPSQCTGVGLTATLDVVTYQDPAGTSQAETVLAPITGCEDQVFRPVLHAAPTTGETDSPSGLDLVLGTEQFVGFAASPGQIRDAVVNFPEGFTINPDAADGQTACADADANFGTELPANCPDSAKIGTFTMLTPALPGPLEGSIYIGDPKPGDQYRLFMTASGYGIHAKLIGSAQPNPQTGRLTVVFKDLPQVPFSEFSVHLFSSQRALMATPTRCTIYRFDSTFKSWNGELAPQTSPANFGLTSGPNGRNCPGLIRPFTPRLVAGTSLPTGGAFSDFTLKLDRDDGDQYLGDLNFRMPPGFTGSLRGLAYCPDAAIQQAANTLGRTERDRPSCPAASQIGTTNVAAGPGTHPFNAVGKIYMAGPFKGAPLSLAAVTPALAGPYDYGTVVVRVALHVDPLTAQVKAVSDTVPSIIGGIPIRMRSISVSLDRPNFTINPTNCSPFTVDSEGIGDQGTVVSFSSYFQAVNCGTLPFRPTMTITQLGSRADTKRNRNPRLRFELRTRPGDANLRSIAVTLPRAFQVDQRHLANICAKSQLEKERCKGRQPIGTAEVKTPLLDQPLSGPAYAVSGYGKLPHLAFILEGQVMLIPQGESASDKVGALRTVVPVIPDAPIGYFALNLLGGKQGYLINTRDLCRKPKPTKVEYAAQNGKVLTQQVRLKASCGRKGKQR